MSEVLTDNVDRLIDLDELIKSVEANLKELKQERSELADLIAEEWAAVGKQSESRRGMTIYRARDLHCSSKAGAMDQLTAACVDEGLDDFVKTAVTIGSLKSWVRERASLDDDSGEFDFSQIPGSILNLINVYDAPVIRVRKSGR